MIYLLADEEKDAINDVNIQSLSMIHDITRIRYVVEDGKIVAIEI